MGFLYMIRAVLLLLIPCSCIVAEPIFFDSFESGERSSPDDGSFRWASPRTVSVEPIPGSPAVIGSEYSMRFSFAPGQRSSEQRFTLSQAYPDLWFRYWLRVPTNYAHNWPDRASNRKFFAVWMDGYSNKGDGPTVVWEFWKDWKLGSEISVHWSEGNYQGTGRHQQHQPFISYPEDQGRWMQIVIHVKAAKSPLTNDGVIEMWRRWEGEAEFSKLHSVTNANISAPQGGPNGWKHGYLMGWANASYDRQTDWYLDAFTVSDKNLLLDAPASRPGPPKLSIGR